VSDTRAAEFGIRPVRSADLAQLLVLCAEHAHFERAPIATPDADRLRDAMFATSPRLYAWAGVDREDQFVGYATATIDFSTWTARTFMHMDCLFVRASHRGQGVGRYLLRAVFNQAAALDIAQIHWQTPAWNVDAQRFYERLGACGETKVRYKRAVGDSAE
jgi:GNAT superfamily N-acetyltransferase